MSSEDRELNLVGKVEMRVALADSDSKLQTLLTTYLPPLLLKLGSEHVSVRNKVISVCQHINKRLKSSSTISLPVPPLLKQFHESESSFIRQFDLFYIQQGLERLSVNDAIEMIPELFRDSSPDTWDAQIWLSTEGSVGGAQLWLAAFHFLLKLLPSWQLPLRGSKEETAFVEKISWSRKEINPLAQSLARFLLYEGNSDRRSVNLTPAENTAFSKFDQETSGTTGLAPLGARLAQTKAAIANFLFTSLFSDSDRFMPAVVLSADSTQLAAFRIGDTMFKQCDFDLESIANVKALTHLYLGQEAQTPPPAKLRMRALALLSKSRSAAKHTEVVLKIMRQQLFSEGDQRPGLEANKLRSGIFAFLTWVVRIGQDKDLLLIAPEMLENMKDFIESQGWPSPDTTGTGLSSAEVDLRGKAYESIGILAAKLIPNIELVKWLFTSSRCDLSGSQIHVSIEEALGRVMGVFPNASSHNALKLKPLLVWNATAQIGDIDPEYGYPTRRSTKFAVVRFANRCLPFSDVDARWIDLCAIVSEDGRQEVVEEGMRGLDPNYHQLTTSKTMRGPDSRLSKSDLPIFSDLVIKVFGSSSNSELASQTDVPGRNVLNATVAFCRNVLCSHALANTENAIPIESDWERRIDALIANNAGVRATVRTYMRRNDSPALVVLLEAAIHGTSLGLARCGELAVELCSLSPNELLAEVKEESLSTLEKTILSNNLQVQAQASRTYGILASLPIHATHFGVSTQSVQKLAMWREAVGQTLNHLRGSLLSTTFLLTRRELRNHFQQTDAHLDLLSNLLADIVVECRDLSLREAASISVGQLSLCWLNAHKSALQTNAVVEALTKDARKEHEISVAALGRLAWAKACHGELDDARVLTNKLYALHDIKRPELHFVVGEALSVAGTGWRSASTTAEHDIDADLSTEQMNEVFFREIVEKVMQDCKTTKPSLKKASAIWLLNLVQYCGKERAIRSCLRQCQAAFARLLSDRDELVQETGSRGLGLVYEMGDQPLRDDLIRDLVQSFTGNNKSNIMGGTVDEDTELFDVGALPTGEGSITTYKDIVRLANEMGDPSLVYRFMNLASNNAIWSSRSAFGKFGLGSILADSSYLRENKKFYPKLYRYRFDPNLNVRRSMDDIWKALVKDSNAVMEENFDIILTDLLQSVLGKEWRVREASCAAIADLIQGREVEKYEKYLDDIWTAAFRVLDDIKETVRVAAMTLCRTLTNLLIRNLEIAEGTTKRAVKMLEHAMPFLLRQLDSGSAKEVQQYAIVTLLQVVRKAPSRALRPFAPVILETLVHSLSSLEHESINYLHLNAEKYGLTAEKLDNMRMSSLNSSPMTEAIDHCLESLDTSTGETVQITQDALNRLKGTFKTAIGLPSKVGLSRVLVTLVLRHHVLFRPFADDFVVLVRRHIFDRNETISVAFSMSLAYLVRLASDKQVGETAAYAERLYFASEETSHRLISAEIVASISKVSNDVFMRFAPKFLPLAFVGRQDDEAEIKNRFEESWKSNVGGSGAVALYLSEIVDLITANIGSPRWSIKHACCFAVAEIVGALDNQSPYTDAQAEKIWPVLDASLCGKTWEGKEKVIAVYPKFVRGAKKWWTARNKDAELTKIILREARRTNPVYRPYAIAALGEYAGIRDDLNLMDEIMPVLVSAVEETLAEDADRMVVDSAHANDQAREGIATCTAVVLCLFQSLDPVAASPPVLNQATILVAKASTVDSRSVRDALTEGAKIFFGKCSNFSDPGIQPDDAVIKKRRYEIEMFSSTLVGRLLNIIPFGPSAPAVPESEGARSKRAAAVLAYFELEAAGVLGPSSRPFTGALEKWLETERSGLVRESLTRALAAASTHRHSS